MLVSSAKFQGKSQEVLKDDLEKKPISFVVEKRQGGSTPTGQVQLEDTQSTKGGLMLYTSGTTSRPVGYTDSLFSYWLIW